MLHIAQLSNISIYEQLKIEEALLRCDKRNWCLINSSNSEKAIVMGIAGDVSQHVNISYWQQNPIAIIKRFTGGGTVVVDAHTLFVTFIINRADCSAQPVPCSIMQWTGEVYKNVFNHNGFALLENDYVFQNRKIGGNAQYIQKERWLHHTSFLWDYCQENMQYLQIPKKVPSYRAGRGHIDFIQRMRAFVPCRDSWMQRLQESLHEQFQQVQLWDPHDLAEEVAQLSYRITTRYIDVSLDRNGQNAVPLSHE